MSTTPDIVAEWLHEKREALVGVYRAEKIRASGQWERTLVEKVKEDGGTIRATLSGQDYTEFMQNGRRPNANQTPEALRKWVGYMGRGPLAQWVKDKGVNINPFAVAYKIAREGVRVPNAHNPGDLISRVVNKDAIDELGKRLALAEITRATSEIRKILEP